MKLFVATARVKEVKPTDFCYAREGEIVYKHDRCASENHGQCCKCGKSLCGTTTGLLTNLVRVADVRSFNDCVTHPSMPDLLEAADGFEENSVVEITTEGYLLREGSHVWDDIIDV